MAETEAPGAPTDDRGQRRRAVGVVQSAKMDKTIVVQSQTKRPHEKYGKFVRHYTKYHAHDEENAANEGDKVEIEECRPYSKTKHWRLLEVLETADT